MQRIFQLSNVFLILIFSLGVTVAQDRPGGNNGTPSIPTSSTPSANTTMTSPEITEDWEDFEIPSDVPHTLTELEAALEQAYLLADLDLSNLDFNFDFVETNQEAYTAIVGFAATHMGTRISPLYAQKVRSSVRVEGSVPDEITNQLPDEVQNLLTSLANSDIEGATYYAVLQNGLSAVYTANDCSGRRCTVDMGQLQFNIEEASLGVYTLYREVGVNSADAALNLILSSFPVLRDYSLTPIETEAGYAYSVINPSTESPSAYFVSAVSTEDHTTLFIAAAISEGFVELGLWSN